jgi:putative sterol carrier protein
MTAQQTKRRRRRPADVVADLFARNVASASDQQLERGMRGWRRRPLLRQIFRQMPKSLNRGAAEGVSAVVEFRIGGRRDGAEDRYQAVIEDGRCFTTRRVEREATMTLRMDAVTFIKMITGVATGPELFMTGKLAIEGDLMLAARMPSLFRIASPGKRA